MWYGIGMKKYIICIILSAALLLALAGCKGKEPVIVTPEPTPEIIVTPDPHEGMVEVPDGNGGTVWIVESKILEPFAADPNAFAVSDTAAVYNGTGLSLVRGIDVSDHQGTIDWQAVAASGVRFAMIRCGWRGYSGGSLNEDDSFRANIEGAQAAGIDVGVYFFSQAISVIEAAEEAVFTVKLLADYDLQLPVFYDWEFIGTDTARTDGMDGETLTECTLEYCRLIESAGYTPGVYTNLHNAYNYYDLDALDGLCFWYAGPGEKPLYYYDHDFWQYSFTGTVPGIDAEVDLDAMYVWDETIAVDAAQTQETRDYDTDTAGNTP